MRIFFLLMFSLAGIRFIHVRRRKPSLPPPQQLAYIANMTHELRAPMHIILNFTRLMLDGAMGELTSDQTQTLQTVHNSATHLMTIINDLLDVAKIEAGQLTLKKQTVDLSPLLLEMQDSAQALIQQKPIAFQLHEQKNLPPVQADPVRLRQIFLNLIANAVRYTDSGSITLRCYQEAQQIIFCVADTGIGIPADKRTVIFERFQQGSAPRGGTGLGLTIVHDLVRLHGGQVWVESRVGAGSQFYFSLPC